MSVVVIAGIIYLLVRREEKIEKKENEVIHDLIQDEEVSINQFSEESEEEKHSLEEKLALIVHRP